MKRRSVRRRDVLTAAGGTLLGLPWLEALSKEASAQAVAGTTEDGRPKRLLIYFKGNGVYADEWFPTEGTTQRDFTLNRTTAPLEPYRDKLLFLDGIDNHVINEQPRSPGEEHNKGSGSILTGWELNEGNILGANGSSLGGYGKGPSIDQVIAQQVGAESPIRSLQVGAHTDSGNELSRVINYEGNDKPIQSQKDPNVVFSQVFEQRAAPTADTSLTDRRSQLLDFTARRFASLSTVVSRQDQLRLDEHSEHLRSIERRLAIPPVQACEFPKAPEGINANSHRQTDAVLALHRDMIVQSFACNLTRVGTLMLGNGANPLAFTFLDDFGGDHAIGHGEATRQEAVDQRRGRHLWGMEQLHDILAALEAVPEGGGTLLDSTLVMFCSENSNGSHSQSRLPFVLAGDLGGHFDTGRLLKFGKDEASHSQLLISVLNAFGIEGNDFGNPDFHRGPLPGLTA